MSTRDLREFTAIHDALKNAGIEYAAFSTDGAVVFGDPKSIEKAAEAFHSHAQIDYFRTEIRHWRDECGKLQARLMREHEVTTSDGFTVLVNADGRVLKVIAGPAEESTC